MNSFEENDGVTASFCLMLFPVRSAISLKSVLHVEYICFLTLVCKQLLNVSMCEKEKREKEPEAAQPVLN